MIMVQVPKGKAVYEYVKYNSVALLLWYNQDFFHPEVLDFLPINFPNILSISGKPHLFSWEIFYVQ